MAGWALREIWNEDDSGMAWAIPQYSREEVNRSGRVLVSPAEFSAEATERAFAVISNWRSSHSFPLNTFQATLRSKAKQISTDCLVAQRLKRLSSIAHKLRRLPDMKLSQMQDIAGCRAIMPSVAEVDKLVDLYKSSDIRHTLVHEDDYIRKPKASGYRSIHRVYRYFSNRKETYNSLKVEMQFRSAAQHAWATAVETVGTFIQQALKSSQGEEEWLRFFALMGTAIAKREDTPLVPNTPTDDKKLKQELRRCARKLKVETHLQMYATAVKAPEIVGDRNAHYYLLELDASAKKIRITGYEPERLEQATNDYLTVERQAISGPQGERDAVLVSVESLEALKRAYPNYFLDTHRFIRAVKHALGEL